MAQRHWLDPIARQLLRATGQLPLQKRYIDHTQGKSSEIDHQLNALKQKASKNKLDISTKVDVNRATASDWRQLPGCTDDMVELLLRLQQGGVQLSNCEDLFQLLELPRNLAKQWTPCLIFRWYGDSPPLERSPLIDINYTDINTLKRKLNWSHKRLNNLMKERQKRPFKNLADLQERLILPPVVIENLIGVVRFGQKSVGPLLPPSS